MKIIGPRLKDGHFLSSNARRLRKPYSPEYQSYAAMKQRCLNPNHKAYENYGGRKVTIDPTWLGLKGFKTFLADMGPRMVGTTLDRIDNDLGYFKSNCRWSTRHEQRINQRRPKLAIAA